MAYKYHDFSPPAISASTIFVRDFQALLDDQFDIASDVWDILEETVIGSGNLETVRVRITGAISTLTSEKLPDDFKQLIFSKTDHNAELGKKYKVTRERIRQIRERALRKLRIRFKNSRVEL